MRHARVFHPAVILVAGRLASASFLPDGAGRGYRLSSGVLSGENSGPRAPMAIEGVDPFKIARAWPQRWQAYLRASFRTAREVAHAFDVSERTAGFWWTGEMGCKAPHLVVALKRDHDRAARMLLEE